MWRSPQLHEADSRHPSSLARAVVRCFRIGNLGLTLWIVGPSILGPQGPVANRRDGGMEARSEVLNAVKRLMPPEIARKRVSMLSGTLFQYLG